MTEPGKWVAQLTGPASFTSTRISRPVVGQLGPVRLCARSRPVASAAAIFRYFGGALPREGAVAAPGGAVTSPHAAGTPLHTVVGDVLASQHPAIRADGQVMGGRPSRTRSPTASSPMETVCVTLTATCVRKWPS